MSSSEEKSVPTASNVEMAQHLEKGPGPSAGSFDGSGNETGEAADNLTPEHRRYLIEKHGTAELDPMPCFDDADPLNWPQYLKMTNICIVSFHAFMATFTAAAIQSAFVETAKDHGVTIEQTSYLSSIVIAVLGVTPLFWRPLAQVYGRRPIFLGSLIGSLVCNIGCAASPTYATMAFCRALTAFFVAPGLAIGGAVVAEMVFKKDRGVSMGIWTTMTTLGVPFAPFLFGFVALRVGYRWIYYILAITNGVQFIVHFIFGAESRYIPNRNANAQESEGHHRPGFIGKYLNFRRIDPTPLRAMDFIRPLVLFARPCVIIPTAAHAMVFLWAGIMICIEIPQLFPEYFGFNTQQVGLQSISIIVGTVLGEQIGGISSDLWMRMGRKSSNPGHHRPEFRLWLGYIGSALSLLGIAIFLAQMDRAIEREKWDITPLIGAAIASAGSQVVTTVMITYAIDCYRTDADSIGVFVSFVRQIWGFIGPFWFPPLIAKLGLVKSMAAPFAMITAVSIFPIVILQIYGMRWR